MRFVVLALALFASTPLAFAQDSEMDRAESELRDAMAPAASAGARVERVSPDEIRIIMPSDITFDFNRADLRYEFLPRVQELASTLRRFPGMTVDIVGHADAIGSDVYNQRLSERRAYSVGDVLSSYGVNYGSLSMSGRGEWEPIASNNDEWGRARNRRVEIRVLGAKK